jgi:DNA-binding IclR family transcriptional regulator
MAARADTSKSKTARRVIEILEFFDERPRSATAMEIARRYQRPQSSTWELLSSLVELGLLYKDPGSRLFRPTPRAAMLGSMFQPRLVRDGRLSMVVDGLTTATGLSAAVVGLVGLDAQVFRWSPPAGGATIPAGELCGGAQAPLHQSAAGWLLLSTVPPGRRDGMLRRLRAEAPIDQAFNVAEVAERIQSCRQAGVAIGPAGFGAEASMCAVQLPAEAEERPMALGLVFDAQVSVDLDALAAMLRRAALACAEPPRRNVVELGDYRTRPEERSHGFVFDQGDPSGGNIRSTF